MAHELLHRHPALERNCSLADSHVIVDQEDWEKARAMLGSIPSYAPADSGIMIERDMLRDALVKVIGVDGKEELELMKKAIYATNASAEDKAVTEHAIRVLINTI
jgi:hypothetical protein